MYKQKKGAGIGERGSACVARTTMSIWDKLWARKQLFQGLITTLFIRYIDDIRIYLHPINKGWSWDVDRWTYDDTVEDDLSYEERTRRNILLSLNTNLDSIRLTVEGESDFKSGMLPTLDFQTKVRDDWEVEFKYYEKPMSSGLVIQQGTVPSKQTIFSSLR